jgi:nitric oxide reductase large subunit
MLKFFTFVESRPRGSFLTQATKLVGSYHAHVKTLVRQYETAKAKKENSLKWLMLWTYQSQVALAYISAYPSEPEINPSDLIDEMMTKVAVFIDGNTLLNVIQFFVENNEEDGAISLAQTAVAMQETSKKIEIMNVSVTGEISMQQRDLISVVLVYYSHLHEAQRSSNNARHCCGSFRTSTEHAFVGEDSRVLHSSS